MIMAMTYTILVRNLYIYKGISETYIEIIKYIYENVIIRVKTPSELTELFSIQKRLHQGSNLNSYLLH